MNLNDLTKNLNLIKASLATKDINKVNSDKLEDKSETKMKDCKHMNGKNVEQYDYKNEKKLEADVGKIAKQEEVVGDKKPEGLKDKRQPVTHDECGRPFGKDEQKYENINGQKLASPSYPEGKRDKVIKALSDAGHRESALLLKNWDEMDKTAEEFAKKCGYKSMKKKDPVPADIEHQATYKNRV